MNEEMIAPCPFCGAIPHMEFSHEAGQWDVYELECDCGISVYGPCGHEGDAAKAATIRKWNTRTPAEPRPADGEMIEIVAMAIFDDDAQWKRLPENYREPVRKQARRVLAAYNPNERLREALETIAFLTADGTEWADWKHLGDVARTALSPLPQGEE